MFHPEKLSLFSFIPFFSFFLFHYLLLLISFETFLVFNFSKETRGRNPRTKLVFESFAFVFFPFDQLPDFTVDGGGKGAKWSLWKNNVYPSTLIEDYYNYYQDVRN